MTPLNTPELKLFLLGPPRIELAGQSVFVQRRKVLALLVYLAVNRTPQRRDSLTALFWPESSHSSARTALSRHCSILKKLLGEQWFMLETEMVGLRPRAELWLDVAHFRQALTQCTNADADPFVLLTNAVALYRADFLNGFTLSDCPDFDDWQALQTETLRQTLGNALVQLVQIHLHQGSYSAGIALAQRWLSLDPWQELAHQQMMTLHVQQQAPAAAMRHYEQYQRTLAEEIGVAPGAEITALYEQVRRGKLQTAHIGRQGRMAKVELPAFLQQPAGENDAQSDAPFVAREQELARLQHALDAAKAGQGQPLFVIGGAGRGKTTLLSEFSRRALANDPDLLVVSGHANAYTGIGDPYLPWRAALKLLLGDVEAGVAGGQLTLVQARRLWMALPITLPLLADHAPDLVGPFIASQSLLARAALVIDNQGDWLPRLEKAANASSMRLEQARLFAQFTALLHAIAARRPLLLILEDLHWADASSINLLFHCCRQLSGHAICLLGAYRHNAIAVSQDGHPHPLVGVMAELKRQYGDIWLDLAAVDANQGRHFVDAYLDAQAVALTEPSAQDFRQALFAHTRGHPLFTVELVHDLQERGDLQQAEDGSWSVAHATDWARLPAKVEGVIEQRLASVAEDLRQALTVASVEGEIFTAEVVALVQGGPARALVLRLSGEGDRQHRLVNAQALEWVGSQRLAHYRFRHHLFQRYLYQQLDESERVYLHEAVGQAIEALYGEQIAECAVQLAHHFQLAGRANKAIHYLERAAHAALHKSAYAETERHVTLALDLLAGLPLTPERNEQELRLQVALGQTLLIAKGFGRPEVAQAFNRARELCRQGGETPQFFTILFGLCMYYSQRPELHSGQEVGQQLLRIAQRQEDEALLLLAHERLGLLAFHLGQLASSQTHLAQVIAVYTPQQHHALVLRYGGIDSGVFGRFQMGRTLWSLGYPDQALRHIAEAIALARTLPHPLSLIMALAFGSVVYLYRGEVGAARLCVDEMVTLTTEHGFMTPKAIAISLQGQVMIVEGVIAAGIAVLEQGLAERRDTGA